MGLEDVVNTLSSSCSAAARLVFGYPKIAGAAAALFSVANFDSANLPFSIGVGVSVYGLVGIVNDYFLGNRESVFPDEKSGLIKRAEHFVFNHAKPFAAAYGLAASAFFGLGSYKSQHYSFLELLNVFGSTHFLLLNAFLHVRKKNELFLQAYKRLKSKNAFIRAWDYVLENPWLPASLAGAAACAGVLRNSFFGLKNMPVLTLEFAALVSADSAFAVYSLGIAAAALFHSSSFRVLKGNACVFWHSVRKNYACAEAACRGLVELSCSAEKRSAHYLRLANIYFEQGKFDYGLLGLQKVLESAKNKTPAASPLDLIQDFVMPGRIADFIRLNLRAEDSFGEPVRSLNLAAYNFKLRRFEHAIKNLDSAVLHGGDKTGIGIIRAAALESVDAEKADSAWQDVVSGIISLYQDRFERISFTSKEVLKLSFDGLLANNFVFARNPDSAALKKEHDLSRFVFSCYSDLSVVPKPYYFGMGCAAAYSVSSCMQGIPLSGCSITDSDILGSLHAYFDFCQRTTAEKEGMHDFYDGSPVLDYLQVYEDKFLGRIHVSDDKKEMLRAYFLPVIRLLDSRPRHFTHGNLHPGNIIKGPDRHGLIDFGDACFSNICFGVEQLLGHALVHAGKEKMYEAAYDFSEGVSKDVFFEDCVFSSAFVAAHLLGRSVCYNEQPVVHYKDNLVQSVSFLAENFFSGREKLQLLDFAGEIHCLDIE